jgi:hypothetical protein
MIFDIKKKEEKKKIKNEIILKEIKILVKPFGHNLRHPFVCVDANQPLFSLDNNQSQQLLYYWYK